MKGLVDTVQCCYYFSMGRVVHFEINAENPESASQFYSEVFDWVISKKENDPTNYWLIHTGRHDVKGINGGLKKRHQPKHGVIPTVDVEDLDECLKKVEKAGGKVVTPKAILSNTGFIAYCSDPEGNVFALLQYSKDAK